jgi:hypothetical protein
MYMLYLYCISRNNNYYNYFLIISYDYDIVITVIVIHVINRSLSSMNLFCYFIYLILMKN